MGNYDLGCVTNGTVAACPSNADCVFLAAKEKGRRNNIQFHHNQYESCIILAESENPW